MLARFGKVLSGICRSLTSLTLDATVSSTRPNPLPRPNRANRIRIGSFNVNSLGSKRKKHETLPEDLRRYRVDILGLQETKIYDRGEHLIDDFLLLTLQAKTELHGIGFAISPRLRPFLQRYWSHSDRIGILKLRLPHIGTVNIVNAYSPHSGYPLEAVDRFYADLSTALTSLPRRDLTFLTWAPAHAKLGRRHDLKPFLGNHGRGYRNRNGNVLASFCQTHNLFVTNTDFPKRAKNITTWTQRRSDHSIYNQIDYILCSQNCRRLCVDAQSWGGTLTSSDHKLVTADFTLEGAAQIRFRPRSELPRRLHLARDALVHDEDARDAYVRALIAASTEHSIPVTDPIQQRWNATLQTTKTAAELAVGFSPQRSTRRYIDATLTALSEQQRHLRLRVQNDHAANIAELRRERNAVLRQIHQRCRELAFQALDAKISRIEELHDSVRMYSAVRELFPRPPGQVTVHDSTGKYILHRPTANNLIRSYFKGQLTDPTHAPIIPSSDARPLSSPITGDELARAFRRLSNGRASGPDDIPAELLKYGTDQIAEPLAALINDSFALGQPLELGEGTLLCLPKPNKSQGECSSLRPIVLLNSIRKAVSLVVLNRIRSDVDNFLSPHQSGFRAHRSTADAVWAHEWLTARATDRRETVYVLGIDLSRAFDSIDRSKLITVLQTFLQDDEVRLIRLLLSHTTLSLRSSNQALDPFESNVGTPQGDSLSPVLFTIYLEAALRDLSGALDVPHNLLQQMIVYADDADFICTDPSVVQLIQDQAPAILSRWSLHMNLAKTEVTKIRRHCNPSGATRHARAREETWRHTKKLGTLLGDIEDLSRRKSLATLALHRLWSVWPHPTLISPKTRIRLYNTYVLPILLYNCATWALTKSELHGLESFHRRQLRYALGYRYPRHISNARLYDLCDERPLRPRLTQARWRLFGHVLRRNPDIPANLQMRAYFFSTAAKWRGRPRTTLPSTLDHDLVSCGSGFRLRTAQDLEVVRTLAQDRKKWKTHTTSVLAALPAERDSTYADTTLCRGLARLSLARA